MAAEVNNTFGERHLYLPEKDSGTPDANDPEKYYIKKAFHVSPFNNLDGRYEFSFPKPAKELDIRINLIREGSVAFSARLWGKSIALTSAGLLKLMLRNPAAPHLTKPRIFLQAARLFFGKKLKYHNKPDPVSPMTIKRKS
jgi:cyclopropane-fatty-acyl-phospholipid synthase